MSTGRTRIVVVAATIAATIAGTLLTINGLDDGRRTAPAKQPKPSRSADQIIADGRLHDYA